MLKLAFDIRSLSPLIYFEKEDRFVYNAEMMCTASEAVAQYMDDNFQQFLHNLRNGFVPEGSAVEAFAVSSGTQCAIDFQSLGTKKRRHRDTLPFAGKGLAWQRHFCGCLRVMGCWTGKQCGKSRHFDPEGVVRCSNTYMVILAALASKRYPATAPAFLSAMHRLFHR